MDEGRFSISGAALYERLGNRRRAAGHDVRRAAAFDADDRAAVRHEPSRSGAHLRPDKPIVIYCVHRQEVSERTVTCSSTGLVMYDAFYAWCHSCQDEKHNWTPAAA